MNNAAPSELQQSLRSLKPQAVRAAWFSVLSSLLVLAPSAYMLEVYDRVVNSRSHTTLVMLTLAVLGAYVVMEILEWARSAILHEASHKFDAMLSKRVVNAMFQANLKKPGAASAQPMADFRSVREFISSPVVLAVMEVPTSLVFLVLIFAMSPVLGWAAAGGAVVQTLVAWLNEGRSQPPLLAANRGSIAAQQYADSTLRNAQVIEAMGMLPAIHRRWMKMHAEFLKYQAQASNEAGFFQAISKSVQTILSSMLLGLGCWLVLHNALAGGSGMMIIASVLGGRVLAPLVQIVSQWRGAVNARIAWERLDALLRAVPPKPPGMPLPAPKGQLRVEAVTAGAPGAATFILRNVSFALEPGEVVAVIGPSAAGKTTLARLLVGLWPAASGTVRLDGADVYTWDKVGLGPSVGYLPQGVELLEGTVAENIARFGEVDLAKVQAAAQAVGIHDMVAEWPEGYNTPVGVDGAKLSGGQRQRIALARALYGEPAFVVLDEPNASLDEAGDQALAQAILALKAKGTTFVVNTHRSSILPVTDKLLVLRDGQAQAFGPRDEVLAALKKATQGPAPAPAAPAPAPAPAGSFRIA